MPPRTPARVLAVLMLAMSAAPAAAQEAPPRTEPNFLADLEKPKPCAMEKRDRYEAAVYAVEGWKAPKFERYPGACQRLRFAFGPLLVKPGQNDVLVEPVRIEKPMRDGFVTRIRPNLVRADGKVPPVEEAHLHHGTWLSIPDYGNGPFFAAGEEKTVAPFPRGYGMPIRATDVWLLLYMIHSAISAPFEAYITYDIDFVPKAAGEKLGLKPAYPVWTDVRPSAYPVFNTQRAFGGADGRCTWPKEQCASFDPWGKRFTGQGQPGNGRGTDMRFPGKGGTFGAIRNFQGGTLIGIGGHLHPGGLESQVDLVRGDRQQRIYTGKPVYWNRKDPNRGGGPPTSWDYSMRVTGLPYWGVRIEPGDKLRSNAVYDTRHQSTYENMGIAVALIAPDTPDGKPTAPGVNPFEVRKDRSDICRSRGVRAERPTLCDKGFVTHGHLKENANHGAPSGTWSARRAPATQDVAIANFVYAPGDLSMRAMSGIPTVPLGSTLRFFNADGLAIYHSATTCAFPCLGRTGAAFPLADGATSKGRTVDFDSGELGIGAPVIGPAKQTLSWDLPVTREEGYQPGEVVTYFCRIHPFMRGAFEVSG